MLCGLGIPSLRSLWGAVRNRQLYILQKWHYCGKNFTRLYSKKNYEALLQKKITRTDNFFLKCSVVFFLKNPRTCCKKKLHVGTFFFVHELHFSRDRCHFPVIAIAAVDCAVDSWGSWATCSRSCEGGSQSRSRSIITHPQHGGAACPDTQESRSCNTQSCRMLCSCLEGGEGEGWGKAWVGGMVVTGRSLVQWGQKVGRNRSE